MFLKIDAKGSEHLAEIEAKKLIGLDIYNQDQFNFTPENIKKLHQYSTFIKSIKADNKKPRYTQYGRINVETNSKFFGPMLNGWYSTETDGAEARALINIYCDTANKETVVLDPFCGNGTIPIECNYLNLNSIVYEISPVFSLVAKVKLNIIFEYKRLLELHKTFLKTLMLNTTLPALYFHINETFKDEKQVIKDFYILIVISALKYYYINKSPIRVEKILMAQKLYKRYMHHLKVLNQLIKKYGIWNCNCELHDLEDSRDMKLDREIDLIITEIPGINDYFSPDFEIYRLLHFHIINAFDNSITAYAHIKKVKYSDTSIQSYMNNLKKVFKNCLYWLKNNSYIVVIMQNARLNKLYLPHRFKKIMLELGCKFEDRYALKNKKTALVFKKNKQVA